MPASDWYAVYLVLADTAPLDSVPAVRPLLETLVSNVPVIFGNPASIVVPEAVSPEGSTFHNVLPVANYTQVPTAAMDAGSMLPVVIYTDPTGYTFSKIDVSSINACVLVG